MTDEQILQLVKEHSKKDWDENTRTHKGLMPDDLHKKKLLTYKSLQSYKGYIPSTDFTGEEYYYYLQYASAGELEQDIVTEKTYRCISAHDNWDDDEGTVDAYERQFRIQNEIRG